MMAVTMRAASLIILCMLQSSSGLRIVAKEVKDMEEEEVRGEPVFYTIIMGKLAFRHQVSLWLSSVRLLGKFKGEAVIVTDKPICLSKTLDEAKLLGPQLSSDDLVDVYGPAPGYTGNIHIVKRPTTRSINRMKLEKARGWLNVGMAKIPHKVSSIIYTDEDIVIAKDVTEFLSMTRTLDGAGHTLALFRDTGLSKGELHTGVVVMFPGTNTDNCMRAWGRHLTGIDAGPAANLVRAQAMYDQQIYLLTRQRDMAAASANKMQRNADREEKKAQSAKDKADRLREAYETAEDDTKKEALKEQSESAQLHADEQRKTADQAAVEVKEAQAKLQVAEDKLAAKQKKGSSLSLVRKASLKVDADQNAEEAFDNEVEDATGFDSEIKEDQLLEEEIQAFGPDQQALGKTRECKADGNIQGIKILPKPYFWFPTPYGLRNGRTAEFVHFTNTGRWKRISHQTIREYLDKIGIPSHIDPTGSLKKDAKACQLEFDDFAGEDTAAGEETEAAE